jgi:predicted MFS family arabinose efflux permease
MPADNRTGRRVTGLFIMLFLLYMFDYIDRLIVTSLFPYMKADLGISDAQAGSLVSAVYWSIVIFAFPVSLLIDRWSRRRSIGLMVALWSVATGAAAFIKTFPQLFLTRLGVGIGEAGYSPGGNALISAMYPREKRSRMMGLWNASIPLGSAIGTAVGGVVASHWGWKSAFGLVAFPGLIIGILFFFFARDYRTVELIRKADHGTPGRRMNGAEVAREILTTPSLLLTYFGFAGNTFLTSAYLTWLPSYFNRTQGLPPAQAGLKGSLVMLLALVGAPLGGLLADVWMKKRVNARPLLAGITTMVSAALFLVAFAVLQGSLQYVVLLLGGIMTVAYVAAASAVCQDVVHPGIWAVSWSICVVVQNLLGSSLGPLVLGAVSDRAGLPTAMLVAPAVSFAGGILFLIASRFYARDLAKVEKVSVIME